MPLFGNQMVLGVKAQRAVILRTIKVDVERIPKRSKRIAFLRIAAVVRCTRSWIIAEHCHTLQVMSRYLNIIQQAVRVATQYASAPCKLTISSHLFARWHLFRPVGYLRHQQQVDLWRFDFESGVWVMCDVGYHCANFSLPRHLGSRVRSDVCVR